MRLSDRPARYTPATRPPIWTHARAQDGIVRDGAYMADRIDLVDQYGHPPRQLTAVRREPVAPGAWQVLPRQPRVRHTATAILSRPPRAPPCPVKNRG